MRNEVRLACVAALLALLAGVLGSCARAPPQPPPPAPGVVPPPVGFPADFYGTRASRLGTVYRIVPEESQLDVFVHRGGRFAKLGHDHIVTSRELRGYVLVGRRPTDSRFDLWFPVATLSVDEPLLRAAAGEDFASHPSESDIAGTRTNMLGEKLLDAARFPHIVVSGRQQDDSVQAPRLELRITVRGTEHRVHGQAQLHTADGALRANGELSLTHAGLGLTPFSVLGGALAVDERLGVRYRITARAP